MLIKRWYCQICLVTSIHCHRGTGGAKDMSWVKAGSDCGVCDNSIGIKKKHLGTMSCLILSFFFFLGWHIVFRKTTSLTSRSPFSTFFLILDPPSHVWEAWRCYLLYISELWMHRELPALGLRKTKIKERSCSHSLQMFNWRHYSLKNGWVSDVFPLDYIQVFSSELTSDSSSLFEKQ